jgi:hypothetical protein
VTNRQLELAGETRLITSRGVVALRDLAAEPYIQGHGKRRRVSYTVSEDGNTLTVTAGEQIGIFEAAP